MTDVNGIFDYQFESFHDDHSFWDRDFWGELKIEFSSDSDIIDPVNATQLELIWFWKRRLQTLKAIA